MDSKFRFRKGGVGIVIEDYSDAVEANKDLLVSMVIPKFSITLEDFSIALYNYIKNGGIEEVSRRYINMFPTFSTIPDEGLFPTSYHTLSYTKDKIYHNELKDFVEKNK